LVLMRDGNFMAQTNLIRIEPEALSVYSGCANGEYAERNLASTADFEQSRQ
jgi:hypothetical protein